MPRENRIDFFLFEENEIVAIGQRFIFDKRKHLLLSKGCKEQTVFHFVGAILGFKKRFKFVIVHQSVLRFVFEILRKFFQFLQFLFPAEILQKAVVRQLRTIASKFQMRRRIISVKDKSDIAVFRIGLCDARR